MRILIMGVGYIGSALLEELQGEDVYVTTTQTNRIPELKSKAKGVFLLPDFPVDSFDMIVTLVAPHQGKTYEDTYLATAQKLLSQLKKPYPYLLYTSSTSVYEGHAGTVTENTAIHPPSPQGKILKATEELFLSSGNACVLRLGGIYGIGREIAKRASYFSGKKMPTSGNEPTNHIEKSDIISALLFCMQKRLKGIYNLVNDQHPSRKELYLNICASQDLPLPSWGLEEGTGYLVSNAKIKEAGFIFQHQELK
jgi:nucleoside-diphosphate-sugar epimerase